MSDLSYAYLRKLQQEEKESMVLVEVDNGFYTQVEDFIKNKQEELASDHSIDKLREFENIVKVLKDIFHLRQQKIVLRALQSTGEDEEGMTAEEEKLFSELTKSMVSYKSKLEALLEKKNIGQSKKTEPKQFKRIKILKSVPAYAGKDGNIYGPFEPEQEKELPQPEAEFLIKAEMAKPLVIE